MERGAGSGVCRLNFNFPLLRQNAISVKKELTVDEPNKLPLLGDPDFRFQILKAENDGSKTENLFILPGTPYEVHVTDVSSGKYRMELQDVEKSIAYKLEPTAAITLAAVADLPIYISPQLFDIQGVDYNPDNEKMSLPLNVLSYELLENALRRAVKDEDYRMAMAIKQEMDNRKNKKL